MFSTSKSRRHRSERIAGQAWDHLTSAIDSAEASTKHATRRAASFYGDASDRFDGGRKEAIRRANNAYAALAGRRQRTRWQWLAAATLAGAAVGWVVTTVSRQARDRNAPLELPESLADEFVQTRF
jgi:hypothetical protein